MESSSILIIYSSLAGMIVLEKLDLFSIMPYECWMELLSKFGKQLTSLELDATELPDLDADE